MKDCPACGSSVDGLVCRVCGEGAQPEKKDGKAPKLTPKQRAERDRRYNEMRAGFAARGPTSQSLTTQQWANVCRFFPKIAARCRRPMIGPDDPLWQSAKLGPLFRNVPVPVPDDPEASAERAAIQDESEPA